MPLLILGIVLTAVCWYFAWSHIGLVSEYSFFPLWVGYILLVNGLSEVMADRQQPARNSSLLSENQATTTMSQSARR
jgi:hypothetical protein